MESQRDSALLETLEASDPLRQAIDEWSKRVTVHKNPKRNAERKARRAARDTGQHPKFAKERARKVTSTALRTPDGKAYTLVGRMLIVTPEGISTARRVWHPDTELVHRIGLDRRATTPEQKDALRALRVANETAVSKRMRRPIRDTWLNGGMAKLMALAKIGGAHADALLARVAAEKAARRPA